MDRRSFIVLATAFAAAGCSTDDDATSSVDGDGAYDDGTGTYGLEGEPLDGSLEGSGLYGTPSPTIDYVRQAFGDTVQFGYDSTSLDGSGQATVQGWAQWMNQFPEVSVVIQGHCDERGTREYNLALGDRRAASVRDMLVAFGVSPNRVAIVSYGKERPVVAGHDESAWAQNRRAVLTIS